MEYNAIQANGKECLNCLSYPRGQAQIANKVVYAFGFPFLGLASDVITKIITSGDISSSPDFLTVKVRDLVARFEEEAQTKFKDLTAEVVGLQFVVVNDKNLSRMRIGGDDPLKATIYRDFLSGQFKSEAINPDVCVLSCEREWDYAHSGKSSGRRMLRSRVHLDLFGNFKFYAHLGCINVQLVPYVLELLNTLKCLDGTSENPLPRGQDEE